MVNKILRRQRKLRITELNDQAAEMEFQVALKGKKINIPRIGLDGESVDKAREQIDPEKEKRVRELAEKAIKRRSAKQRGL